MNKLLLIILYLLSFSVYAEFNGINIKNKNICTQIEFNIEVTTITKYLKLDIISNNKYGATISSKKLTSEYNNEERRYTRFIEQKRLARARLSKVRLDLIEKNYRDLVINNFLCATPSGLSIPIRLLMDPYNPNVDNKLQYTEFEMTYPKIGAAPTIMLVDTLLNSEYIKPSHSRKLLKGVSLIPGEKDALSSSLVGATHGNIMLFISAMVSDADIYPIAITSPWDAFLSNWSVAAGINHAILNRDLVKTPVINLSLGNSLSGNSFEVTEEINRAHSKNIPVIQAIGNTGKLNSALIKYNPKEITVGYSVNKQIGSTYGNNGPDFIIDESGYAPFILKYGQHTDLLFQTYLSSGATALMSGVVSRMRNTCPFSTPDEIKDSLCKTSTKFSENKYVKCGIPKPKDALDLLKTKPSCNTDFVWNSQETSYAPIDNRYGYNDAFKTKCTYRGGTVVTSLLNKNVLVCSDVPYFDPLKMISVMLYVNYAIIPNIATWSPWADGINPGA